MRTWGKCVGYCLIFLTVQLIEAFPYRFTRLIKIKADGTIEKVVDLISDVHILLAQSAKKTPATMQKSIEPEQWNQLAIAERTLIDALHRLANQQGEKIDLIWEWARTSKDKKYEPSFLTTLGRKFEEEFSSAVNKRINFVLGDTYRYDLPHWQLVDLDKEHKHYLFTAKPMDDLIRYLDTIVHEMRKSIITNIIPRVQKEIVSKKVYEKLWDNFSYYVSNMKNFRQKFGIETNQIEEGEKIGEWLSTLKKKKSKYKDFENKWLSNFVDRTLDLEILIRIFSTDAKHVIVYAGGDHATNIIQILIRDFDFKKIIDIGNYTVIDMLAPLAPSAWKYLEQDPLITLTGKPVERLILPDFWQGTGEWKKENISTIIKEALQGSETARKFLESLLNQAFQAHVDLVNMQNIIDKKTILHRAVEANSIPVIKLLLKYNALTNIKDRLGNSVLHYAKTPEVAQLLLSHGARLNSSNNSGQMPLHIAVVSNNLDLVRVLLEYGADPNSFIITSDQISRALDHVQQGSAMEKLLREYGARRMGQKKSKKPTQRQIDIRTKAVKRLFNH